MGRYIEEPITVVDPEEELPIYIPKGAQIIDIYEVPPDIYVLPSAPVLYPAPIPHNGLPQAPVPEPFPDAPLPGLTEPDVDDPIYSPVKDQIYAPLPEDQSSVFMLPSKEILTPDVLRILGQINPTLPDNAVILPIGENPYPDVEVIRTTQSDAPVLGKEFNPAVDHGIPDGAINGMTPLSPDLQRYLNLSEKPWLTPEEEAELSTLKNVYGDSIQAGGAKVSPWIIIGAVALLFVFGMRG